MPTYTADSSVFAIPERGWWLYTDTQLSSGGQTNPLDQAAMTAARTGSRTQNNKTVTGSTLVFRYYFLNGYAYQNTIDQVALDAIAADLVKARAAGVKLIIRFAYSKDNADDAPVARAIGQIDQLAPVLNAGADVIHALQAGFVGRWGEWYYSNNYGDQNNVSAQNWTDRLAVLDRLFVKLDTRIHIQVRYVGIRQRYLNSTQPNPGGNGSRLGLHNDAFTASYADYGTYTTYSTQSESFNRDYLANMVAVPVGGESETSGDASWEAAQPQLDTYNWSYFNPNYNQDVQGRWSQDNWDTVARLLGHRLRIVSATIPSAPAPGSQVTATVVLTNDGWAPATRNRPVRLVLDKGSGTPMTVDFSVDIRSIAPGQQVTLSATFTAPSTSGTYASYLLLPDASASIASRPEYAIRLANTGMWDSSTGRNALSAPMAVSGSSTTPTLTTTSAGTMASAASSIVRPVARAASTGGGGITALVAAPRGLLGVVKMQVNGVVRVVKLTTRGR